MIDFNEIWRHGGPPALSVESAVVAHNHRTWRQQRVTVGDGHPGVVIIPVANDRVGFIKIWRPTVDEVRLEVPRGFGECDSPETDARRELLEETGLSATRLHPLGAFDLDTGLMPTHICVFEAVVDRGQIPQSRDGEIDEVVWLSTDDIATAIAEGQFKDAITLAALACWSASDQSRSDAGN